MNRDKLMKIICVISVLISSNIWFFMYAYFMLKQGSEYLSIIFYCPARLQLVAVVLAIVALIFSKPAVKGSCIICFVYSLLSLALFLVANWFFVL